MRERSERDPAQQPQAERRGHFRSRSSACLLPVLGLVRAAASACAPLVSPRPQWGEVGATSIGALRGKASRLSAPEVADGWTYVATGAAEDHRSPRA